ncbi:MAG: HDOD domain-containing protein, partial [Dehalococcoidia bacterium]
NSPYYGYARRISTIRDAVVLLGFRAVRSAALASCVIGTLRRSPNLDDEAFWRFSVATGMVAELLARTDRQPHDHAFTAGIVHRLGLLALDHQRPDLLRSVLEQAATEGLPIVEAERRALGFTDAELGGALMAHWNFPPALVEAVQAQATPDTTTGLGGYVARARVTARHWGLAEGIVVPAGTSGIGDLLPSLAPPLDPPGGVEGLLERVDAFLAAALV